MKSKNNNQENLFGYNYRINPGLRIPSRLYTKPKPFLKTHLFSPDLQIKLIENVQGTQLQRLLHLNNCRNVFNHQLPNMGSAYITRLTFDFNTLTVFLLHNGYEIASISGKLFPNERFFEIAFCSVWSEFQMHGYGRQVMNYLKSVLLVYQYFDILTCADNDALSYFQKVGFQTTIQMDPSRWVHRIKEYQSVTLVHCHLHDKIDYLNSNIFLKQQCNFASKHLHNRIFSCFPEIDMNKALYSGYITSFNLSLPKVYEKIAPKDSLNLKSAPILFPFPECLPEIDISLIPSIKNDDINEIKKNGWNSKIVQDLYFIQMKELKNHLLIILSTLIEKYKQFYSRKNFDPRIIEPLYLNVIEKRLLQYDDYYKSPNQFYSDIEKVYNTIKSCFGKRERENILSFFKDFKQLYIEHFPKTINDKSL